MLLMLECSDKIQIHVCRECGTLLSPEARGCRMCKHPSSRPGKTDTCYAAVQLAHEMEGMGVGVNWITKAV